MGLISLLWPQQQVGAFTPQKGQIGQIGQRRMTTIRALYLQDNDNGASMNMTLPNANILNGGPKKEAALQISFTPGGRNNFGDIMSPTVDDAEVLFRDGLVTSSKQSLAQLYQLPNPLDRMAVTANGNLQRLLSSYYDTPVTVVVDYCRPLSPNTWDRRVQLQVYNQTVCIADSQVQVHSEECLQLVESGQVGLGQLFRYLNVLPEFALQEAGPTEGGGFWRVYTLTCAQVSCSIHERFIPGLWELEAPATTQNEGEEFSKD